MFSSTAKCLHSAFLRNPRAFLLSASTMFAAPLDDGVAPLPVPEGFDPDLAWDGADPSSGLDDLEAGGVTPPSLGAAEGVGRSC